ncbi:hypothetical protein [Paenibacillus apiarius]|uniref:Uncharacterized protein n=1 Tax=Paenibacillus apiarius TaxID=46240 RepID=A0ABT4DZ32_9BACL|nr:hypothetical protein [Paenibacillus apiarius]MCY9514782.1 hypothetical protein [Paenibacillus apiarius]MCY9521338.1 hypothetical protein [Paenibacillus apiarius]MCY9554054.1 hypothetical protein [Paenibacillus apiarius]MCY9560428.1 hypothetical protein [Paenibacillus apiarius]MCY9682235.1 hypothetical protein [Paenibacillus apiarius]
MLTANEIFSVIRTDSFFENVFLKEVDWDAELDARDTAEFDTAWNSSFESLHDIDPSESKLIRDIREFAFKQTFRITQNPELAGYTSDDFGLVSKAFESKINNEFIQNLWDSYLQGEFPK